MIEVCGQHYITDPYMQFNYIDCIETIDTGNAYDTVLKTCTDQVGATDQYDNIYNCWSGNNTAEGISLQHQVAVATNNLNPAHTYVPYVVGQGVHSDLIQNEVQTSLWFYVCKNYLGSNKSADCPGSDMMIDEVPSDLKCAREEYFLQ